MNSNLNDEDPEVEKNNSAIFVNSGYDRDLKSFKKFVKDSVNRDGTKI
jgi:hypothetical protein